MKWFGYVDRWIFLLYQKSQLEFELQERVSNGDLVELGLPR